MRADPDSSKPGDPWVRYVSLFRRRAIGPVPEPPPGVCRALVHFGARSGKKVGGSITRSALLEGGKRSFEGMRIHGDRDDKGCPAPTSIGCSARARSRGSPTTSCSISSCRRATAPPSRP